MQDERAQFLAELDTLRRRAAALDQRLTASRRNSTLVPALCLVLGFLLGSISLSWQDPQALAQDGTGPLPKLAAQAAQPGQPARDLVCSSVKIVGPDGKERLTLGYDAISGFVRVHGPDGKVRATLWTTVDSKNGALNLVDDNGKNRVVMSGNSKGGGCALYAPDGQQHAYVGSATNRDGGIVNLFGPQTKRTVELANNDDGGYVWVYGNDGKVRSSLWSSQGSKNGLLTLYNSNAKSTVWLGGDVHGGLLNLRGDNEKNQVMLDCHNQWGGGLFLNSPQGGKLIGMYGNENNGNGTFILYGTDGKERVSMGLDNTGVGQVTGFNAAGQSIRWLK